MMPRCEKSSYTDKQKRQAKHKRRAWATENKVSGGGKQH
jgi:hypothetical protein